MKDADAADASVNTIDQEGARGRACSPNAAYLLRFYYVRGAHKEKGEPRHESLGAGTPNAALPLSPLRTGRGKACLKFPLLWPRQRRPRNDDESRSRNLHHTRCPISFPRKRAPTREKRALNVESKLSGSGSGGLFTNSCGRASKPRRKTKAKGQNTHSEQLVRGKGKYS